MKSKHKVLVLKIIFAILVLAILIIATIYLFPIVKNISTSEGQLQFKETVKSSGIAGFFMLFGLEMAQIVLAIIPGEPMEIMAGMCYGSIGGTLFILFCAFLSGSIIFFAVRKFGTDFVYSFCSKKQVAKIQNSDIFQNPDKVEKIMYILFFIPGTPKDLLTYIAGLLPIKHPLRFVIISTLARIPSVVSSTIAGANLINGDWKISVLAYAITFGIVGLIILIYKIFFNDNDTKEAIKTIK